MKTESVFILCGIITSIALMVSGLWGIKSSQYCLGTGLVVAGFSQLIRTIVPI